MDVRIIIEDFKPIGVKRKRLPDGLGSGGNITIRRLSNEPFNRPDEIFEIESGLTKVKFICSKIRIDQAEFKDKVKNKPWRNSPKVSDLKSWDILYVYRNFERKE